MMKTKNLENRKIAKRGGGVAGVAREVAEAQTGKPVITSKNVVAFSRLVADLIEDASDEDDNKTE